MVLLYIPLVSLNFQYQSKKIEYKIRTKIAIKTQIKCKTGNLNQRKNLKQIRTPVKQSPKRLLILITKLLEILTIDKD